MSKTKSKVKPIVWKVSISEISIYCNIIQWKKLIVSRWATNSK